MERPSTLRKFATVAVLAGTLAAEGYALSTINYERAFHFGFEVGPALPTGDLSCLHKEFGGIAFSGDRPAPHVSPFEQDCSTFDSGEAGNSNTATAEITEPF